MESQRLLAGGEQIKEYQLANELVGRLYSLLGNARTGDRNSRAILGNARAALHKIQGLLNVTGRLSLDIVGDSLFLNGIRLRPSFSNFQAFKSIVDHVRARSIRSFSFDDSVEEDDIIAFASILSTVDPDEDDPYAQIAERMECEGIRGIVLGHAERAQARSGEQGRQAEDPAAAAVSSFASALYFVRKSIDEGIADPALTPRKVKRVAQLVVDGILAHENEMLGLTSLGEHTGHTYQHSLNVCIYSVMLAHRLGLPKSYLREIGVAALFHDNGKHESPAGILNKGDQLDENELEAMQRHAPDGARALTHFRQAERTILRAILVAYLHHLDTDGSGYPHPGRKIAPDTVSRIVRIADIYDSLTSPRSQSLRPYSRNRAILAILANSRGKLDPTLARAFAHVMVQI